MITETQIGQSKRFLSVVKYESNGRKIYVCKEHTCGYTIREEGYEAQEYGNPTAARLTVLKCFGQNRTLTGKYLNN